jgi:hypothetical protein
MGGTTGITGIGDKVDAIRSADRLNGKSWRPNRPALRACFVFASSERDARIVP